MNWVSCATDNDFFHVENFNTLVLYSRAQNPMQLNREPNQGTYQIRSYHPGAVIINDQTYTQSMLVSAMELLPWQPQSINELTSEHLQIILERKPQLFLLGTGPKQIFPPTSTLAILINNKIGVEVMDTGAACRTFNVLIAEGRKVMAGLLIRDNF